MSNGSRPSKHASPVVASAAGRFVSSLRSSLFDSAVINAEIPGIAKLHPAPTLQAVDVPQISVTMPSTPEMDLLSGLVHILDDRRRSNGKITSPRLTATLAEARVASPRKDPNDIHGKSRELETASQCNPENHSAKKPARISAKLNLVNDTADAHIRAYTVTNVSLDLPATHQTPRAPDLIECKTTAPIRTNSPRLLPSVGATQPFENTVAYHTSSTGAGALPLLNVVDVDCFLADIRTALTCEASASTCCEPLQTQAQHLFSSWMQHRKIAVSTSAVIEEPNASRKAGSDKDDQRERVNAPVQATSSAFIPAHTSAVDSKAASVAATFSLVFKSPSAGLSGISDAIPGVSTPTTSRWTHEQWHLDSIPLTHVSSTSVDDLVWPLRAPKRVTSGVDNCLSVGPPPAAEPCVAARSLHPTEPAVCSSKDTSHHGGSLSLGYYSTDSGEESSRSKRPQKQQKSMQPIHEKSGLKESKTTPSKAAHAHPLLHFAVTRGSAASVANGSGDEASSLSELSISLPAHRGVSSSSRSRNLSVCSVDSPASRSPITPSSCGDDALPSLALGPRASDSPAHPRLASKLLSTLTSRSKSALSGYGSDGCADGPTQSSPSLLHNESRAITPSSCRVFDGSKLAASGPALGVGNITQALRAGTFSVASSDIDAIFSASDFEDDDGDDDFGDTLKEFQQRLQQGTERP